MGKTDTTEIMQDSQFKPMDLPVEMIVVDEAWNNRTTLNGPDTFHKGTKEGGDRPAMSGQTIEELSKLISDSKNFVPVTVSIRPDGTYFLVAGFRRMAAIKLLNWKTVPVMAAQLSPAEERRWNILENKGRKDLSTYETALGVNMYAEVLDAEGKSRKGGKASGGKGAEGYGAFISRALGMSRTAVNLYIRLFQKLHKNVLEAWRVGEGIPVTLLDQWASEEPKEQLKLYKAWQGENDAEEGEGEGEGGEGEGGGSNPDAKVRPNKAQFVYAKMLFTEVAKTEKDPELKAQAKGILQALEWATGDRKSLAGINIAESMKKAKAQKKGKNGEAEADAE